MIVKENVTLFICEHCRKKYQIKSACEKHEPHCSHKKENQSACSGCVYLKEFKVDVFTGNDHNGEEQSISINGFSCSKLDKVLYPYKCIRKGLVDKYPHQFEGQELMPSVCEHWNYMEQI
jgi:hypothetical protein